MVRKIEDEDRKLQREEEENRERQERRVEAARQRWIKMLRLPEDE